MRNFLTIIGVSALVILGACGERKKDIAPLVCRNAVENKYFPDLYQISLSLELKYGAPLQTEDKRCKKLTIVLDGAINNQIYYEVLKKNHQDGWKDLKLKMNAVGRPLQSEEFGSEFSVIYINSIDVIN